MSPSGDELDLELDSDLVADQHSVHAQRCVEIDAEVAAPDGAGCREADTRHVEVINGNTVVVDVELNRLGGAVNRELTDELVLGRRCRHERHLGVGLCVEEVAAGQVPIPIGVVGVDRAEVDDGFDGRSNPRRC